MTILIIDGQGGRIGRSLVERVCRLKEESKRDFRIIAVGTNSMATSAMLKGGAVEAATGENPVLVCAPMADVIMGPIGIVTANSLLGEITSAMAEAVGRSKAVRILIPVDKCETRVAGVKGKTTTELIEDAVDLLKQELAEA